MPSSMKLSSRSVETSGEMGYVLGQERSSGLQKIVDNVGERTPSPWKDKAILFQGKHRVRHSFSQSYLDRGFDSTENASAEKVQSRCSGNERKLQLRGRACDDNELVKHMSNLPDFLQPLEKEKTIQGKALNFGVLDWKRLEKWKYTERMPGRLSKKASPGRDSIISASGLPKISPNMKKLPSSRSHYPSLPGKQPAANDSHISSPQRLPVQCLNLKLSEEDKSGSCQKEEEHVECLKPEEKETCNQKYNTAEIIKIGRQQNHFQQTDKSPDQICSEANAYKSKRNPVEEMMSERVASSSSSKQGKHKIALLSLSKVGARGKKTEMRFDEVKPTSKCSPADPQEIVLLVPNDIQKKNFSESSQITESKTSLDVQLPVVAQSRFSDFCSPRELYSGEFSDDIPHSCPLPTSAVDPYNLSASLATDADSITSMSSEAIFSDMSEETTRPSSSVEASNRKQAGFGEQPAARGRSPSPTRRFSFNLGRMSRSFSFKESSAVPQLSSTYTTVKSGPVTPEAAPRINNFERDQANASSRARSSPLRRLLDPLLRHKTSNNTTRPSNGSSHPMTAGPTATKGLPQDKNPKASTFQALLELTFKNGLPFFKLVVENSKDMLAASAKKLPTSEKIDPCTMIYSFYSVHEIKKKGMNWISHGSKSKVCSLGYNIIGQMKFSNFYDPIVNSGGPGEYDARECVLCGVDPAQVDKQMLAFVPNKEIAAIVVKNPHTRVSENQENENSNSITVILPGAVHGIPTTGAPSSLISRWRSSGSCDCGGWDVGCKLQILSDNGQESPSNSIDHLNLFIKGAEQKSRPVFSLKPLSDELYSIELDMSISLLEAFATSVAYVTTQKIPEILDSKGQSEEEHVVGANAGFDQTKMPSFQEQVPARYATCPPLSPVGRI